MEVRYAEAGDIGVIVDVARRAQDALTAAGSQQRLTLPSPDAVAAHIAARAAYVLAEGGPLIGRLLPHAPHIHWGVAAIYRIRIHRSCTAYMCDDAVLANTTP